MEDDLLTMGVDWDGRSQLADDLIAVWPVMASDGTSPVLLITAGWTNAAVVWPPSYGCFLRCHASCTLVTDQAFRLHQGLQVALNGQEAELELLWSFARECRLHDILVMEGVLTTAEKGTNLPLAPLREVLRRYEPEPFGEWDILAKRLFLLQQGDSRDASRLEATLAATTLLRVAACQRRKAQELLTRIPEIEERFGPLGLGLHVQGSIVWHHLRRQQAIVPDDLDSALCHHCSEETRECNQILRRSQAAAKAFHFKRKKLQFTIEGEAVIHPKQLDEWLDHQLSIARFCDEHPLPLPEKDGPASNLSVDGFQARWLALDSKEVDAWQRATGWERWRRRERPYWSWHGLHWPHLRADLFSAGELRAARGSLLKPLPMHRFLLLRMPGLLWHVTATHLGTRGHQGNLISMLQAGQDPVQLVGESLAQEYPHRPSYVRLFGTAGERCTLAARLLLRSVVLGYSPEILRAQLQRCGVSIPSYEAYDWQLKMRTELFPELEAYWADDLFSRMASRLGITCEALLPQLQELLEAAPTPALFRRHLFRPRNQEQRSGKLLHLWQTAWQKNHDRATCPTGVGEVYSFLANEIGITATGRMRGDADPWECRSLCLLDLLDDIRKGVLFTLMETGYTLITFTDESILLQIPLAQGTEERRRMAMELATRMIHRVLLHTTIQCEADFLEEW